MRTPSEWNPSAEIHLEPNADRAVRELKRNVVLSAGPGAGKTELLAQRADLLLRTGSCRYPRRILAISFKKDASRNLRERVRERCGHELASRLDSHTFHAFSKRLIDRYRVCLAGADALDPDFTIGDTRIESSQITFDDMVPLALQILETSTTARNAVRQTYSHVFLDEFQDCTNQQYKLIVAAFGTSSATLTAVGDTKQRIMGWAGALEGIFETFGADFDATPLNLYQNFRSAPRLRRIQNTMIRVMDSPAAVEDSVLAGEEGIAEVWSFANETEEADEIATQVRQWIEQDGIAPSEIAILVFKQPHLYGASVMDALGEAGIAVRNEGELQDLSTEPLVRLIVDFVTTLASENDPEIYQRTLQALCVFAMDEDAEYRDRARWQRYIERERKKMRAFEQATWVDTQMRACIDRLIDAFGLGAVVALSADYELGERVADLVDETVKRISKLCSQGQSVTDALSRFSDDGAVRVMTIHKSKGLEFESVVVMGVENETFWGKIEDERSLFFVAISRAKNRLVVTTSRHRTELPSAKYWKTNRSEHPEFVGYVAAHT